MLTVMCVKWGDRYGPHWVRRLRAMVRKNLSHEHEFVCLTDQSVDGVECWPLTSGYPGWWAKIELFKPGAIGDILYFDLDVVIRGSIDGLVDAMRSDRSKLWMRDDFSYSLRNPRHGLDGKFIEMLGGHGCCNSSVMGWYGDAARKVWDTFTPEVMQRQHGDQNHISRVLWPEGIGFFPDELIGSYKYGRVRNETPCPVTVFHGNPKMDELPLGHEMRRLWEAA